MKRAFRLWIQWERFIIACSGCSSAEERDNLLDDVSVYQLSETVLWKASKYNSVQIKRSCPSSEICTSLVPLFGKSVWRSYSAWKKNTCLCYGKTKMTEHCFYCNPKVFYSFYRTMKLEMGCDLMPEIPTDFLKSRKCSTAICKKVCAR